MSEKKGGTGMAQPITHVFDPQIGLPLDQRSVIGDSTAIAYPFVGHMFFDTSLNGFYYIDRLINGGAGYTIKSIFLSESNALGNLTVQTLTANEVFMLSDGRTKTDQRPITDALAALAQLRPVEYTKCASGDGTPIADAGFIAQEVLAHETLSYLVRADDMHLRYTPLIAYLVRGVQELTARVHQLEAIIKEQRPHPVGGDPV